MMAFIVCLLSVVALLQFFVSYCRSLIAACARIAISEEVREVAGMATGERNWDYARVRQLLQMCPDRPQDRAQIRSVSWYFRMLTVLQWMTARVAPKLGAWADAQKALCTHYAAVMLDRRIAFSREMFSNQMGGSL